MAHHKLAAKVTANTRVDEVIYDQDESGNPLTISTSQSADLSEEQAEKLRNSGYSLIPVDEPIQGEGSQPVGADVVGMSPVVRQTEFGVGVDQQQQQQIDEQVQSGPTTAEQTNTEFSEGGEL